MHSAGKRDDFRRPAIELPTAERDGRNRRAAIAAVACCILPFVIAAGEPASAPGEPTITLKEASEARSERASPTVIIGGPILGGESQRDAVTRSAEAGELTSAAPFVNSLGMEFIPVPGTKVRFCRWDTRVSDWQAFIQAQGDTEQWGLYALDEKKAGWGIREDLSWKHPGFEQTGRHPVVGVSWEDAHRFCAWLSRKEGRTYRLPTDSEWSAAVGPRKYPWGDEFPPPAGAGNYCGREAALKTEARGAGALATIEGYEDGFPRTSPVGSFAANRFGLYDMGGNVWQWCEDPYKASMNGAELVKKIPALKSEKADDGTPCRVLRGASWRNSHEIGLRSASRVSFDPRSRYDHNGFRCVMVIPAVTPAREPSPVAEVARIAPPAPPKSPETPKPQKTPRPTPVEDLALTELRAVRKELKEEQEKVAATLNHLMEAYTKGISGDNVASYNQQVRQAWAERDHIAAQLQDVEESLRTHGGKR